MTSNLAHIGVSMTHQVKGVVDRSTTRDQQTSRGMAQIYGIIVDGVEVETGFRKEHSDGEMVNIKVEWKYGKWNRISNGGDGLPAAVAGNPSVNTAAPKKGGFQAGGGGRGSFPVDPKSGTISIIRQNSMTHASRLVDDMIQHSVITQPANRDDYLKEVLSVALVITDFSSGNDIVQMQAAVAANKAVMSSE